MNRLNSRLDVVEERIIEFGGIFRKLFRWRLEIEIMKEILGDMQDVLK